MLRFGLSFLLGLLFIYSGSSLPSIGTLLLLCAGLLACVLVRPNGLVLLAGFATGLAYGWLAANDRLQDRLAPENAGEVLLIEGRVESLVEADPVESENRQQRFLFAPNDASLPRRIRLTVYSSEPEFRSGETWRLAVKLREPRGFANPAGFDIERWYFREGIGATGYVRNDPPPLRLAAASDWLNWRERALAAIEARTGSYSNAAFLRALAAGDRRQLEPSDWQLLRETGTSHLIAISGLHLSLLALLLAACLRIVLRSGSVGDATGKRQYWLQLLLMELAISAYAVLAGLDTPVQRAWVMVSLGLLAIGLARSFRWSAIYGLAMSIVLLLDPFAPLDAGFWLSFGAVAAILFSVGGRVRQGASWRMALDIQWRLTLLLLPLTLAAFSLFAPASLLANLVAIPFTGFVLLPLLLLALLSWPFEACSRFLFGLANDGFTLLQQFLAFLAEVLPAQASSFSLPLLTVFAAGILLLLLPRAAGLQRLACLVLCMFGLLAVLPERTGLQHGDWRMTALDVGQGTAVVIRTREHLAVYDSGPAFRSGGSAAESVVIPFLQTLAGEPELIIISHQDNDHAGGVEALREAYPAARVLAGDACTAGLEWQWDGVDFRIEHPKAGVYWSSNNGSCVLRISGRHSALLPGDIEAAAEADLLRQGLGAVDVMLAPHHGSRTSSTADFVRATSPALVIFPAGHGNRWNFPKADIRRRWENTGAVGWTTGWQGAVSVTSARQGLQLERWRDGNPRLWRYPAVIESISLSQDGTAPVR